MLPKNVSDDELAAFQQFAEFENRIYNDDADERVNWDENTLADVFEAAGWTRPRVEISLLTRQQVITRENVNRWFCERPDCFGSMLVAHGMDGDDVVRFRDAVVNYLLNQKVTWHSYVAFFAAERAKCQ